MKRQAEIVGQAPIRKGDRQRVAVQGKKTVEEEAPPGDDEDQRSGGGIAEEFFERHQGWWAPSLSIR